MPTTADLLLTRRGIVTDIEERPSAVHAPADTSHVTAVELELAALGYVISSRLRRHLDYYTLGELTGFRERILATLAEHAGGGRNHQPLFRKFPDGIPADTLDLWWNKVLVHFLQGEGQPCLFCRRTGTTHVLDPCQHVVCDQCFDGANYSACPVCEQQVDPSSPFFRASPTRSTQPSETVIFKLLDLGQGLAEETRTLFLGFCARKQALSPIDRDALQIIVKEFGAGVLAWLPEIIPVRENIALIFGTLLHTGKPTSVLERASAYLTNATDVLRLLAVYSGTDGSLIRMTIFHPVQRVPPQTRFWGPLGNLFRSSVAAVPIKVNRFKMAKLSRPFRRALLQKLESFDADRLVEDMLRHQSYWVWAGEFLHPGEYAKRFPNAARAFAIIRAKTPFPTFHSKWEAALQSRDSTRMLETLTARPGDLARRVDLILRTDPSAADAIASQVSAFATPVLLTLRAHLPTRTAQAPVRAYWPKGRVAAGAIATDRRAPIEPRAIGPVVTAIDTELLRRFSQKRAFTDAIIDQELRQILVPFNERTSSSASIALPRGSRVNVEAGKWARLFLHWCEPPNGRSTDLDLSVAFYDEAWRYVGVCSYYQLTLSTKEAGTIARSAGDLRSARPPDGATEFVDIHCEAATRAGIRYAVMVVNAYSGLPFSLLREGFAGLMLREDPQGSHFDPRTVQWKFTLAGEHGIFMPLVFDLEERTIHWLDVHAKGELAMNNVENSRKTISHICPSLMQYFSSGVRPVMWDLALLHAASRCQRVTFRKGGQVQGQVTRHPGESVEAFHTRLLNPQLTPAEALQAPALAILYRGNCVLPAGSTAYALFREQIISPISASDLLS